IFIGKSSVVNRNYQAFQPSTSSLVSVNLLSVISLIGKNKDPKSKLKKKLLKLENENYIDHIFSKEKVRSITSLQGDSLQIFIEKYRPSTGMVSQMTDYELLLYIKRSYKDFIKDEPFSEDLIVPIHSYSSGRSMLTYNIRHTQYRYSAATSVISQPA